MRERVQDPPGPEPGQDESRLGTSVSFALWAVGTEMMELGRACGFSWRWKVQMLPKRNTTNCNDGMPSILKPASSKMMSDPALLCETAHRFLHIQKFQRQFVVQTHITLHLTLISNPASLLQQMRPESTQVCNPQCCLPQNKTVCDVQYDR